jgi:hypothetical protein
VSAFGPLKTAYRDEVERLNRGGIDAIGKEHFTWLYKPARVRALTRKNILAGWAATGLFPWNPDRVLRHTPKLPADVVVSNTDEVVKPPCQDKPLLTPVTPVTTEGLMSLYEQIKQDCSASAADEQSRQRLQKRIQKHHRAALTSFAKQSLLQDHNRVLLSVNKQSQIVRARKPVYLKKGEGKVFDYEDLEQSRIERDAKDKAVAEKGKGTRGRKRKTVTQDEQEEEPSLLRKGKFIRTSEDQESVPRRAPVAKMY